MANFANIIIADSTATNRTFEARYNASNEQQWRYPATADVVVGDHTISMKSMFNRANPDGVHKVEMEIMIPIVDAPAAAGGYSPTPKIKGKTRFVVVGFLPGSATTLSRQNAIAYLKNVLSNTQITDSFVNFAPPA